MRIKIWFKRRCKRRHMRDDEEVNKVRKRRRKRGKCLEQTGVPRPFDFLLLPLVHINTQNRTTTTTNTTRNRPPTTPVQCAEEQIRKYQSSLVAMLQK